MECAQQQEGINDICNMDKSKNYAWKKPDQKKQDIL